MKFGKLHLVCKKKHTGTCTWFGNGLLAPEKEPQYLQNITLSKEAHAIFILIKAPRTLQFVSLSQNDTLATIMRANSLNFRNSSVIFVVILPSFCIEMRKGAFIREGDCLKIWYKRYHN